MGGFECSSHRLKSGRRLDLIGSTKHDHLSLPDYRRLADFGIRTVRDGIRWHLIEQRPNQYDFSSVLPMIRAAREARSEDLTRVVRLLREQGVGTIRVATEVPR